MNTRILFALITLTLVPKTFAAVTAIGNPRPDPYHYSPFDVSEDEKTAVQAWNSYPSTISLLDIPSKSERLRFNVDGDVNGVKLVQDKLITFENSAKDCPLAVEIQLRSLVDGKIVKSTCLPGSHGPYTAAKTAGLIGFGIKDEVDVFNVNTWQVEKTFHPQNPLSESFPHLSADGAYVTLGLRSPSTSAVEIWRYDNGDHVATIDSAPVEMIQFSPDDKQVAIIDRGCSSKNKSEIWSMEQTPKLVNFIPPVQGNCLVAGGVSQINGSWIAFLKARSDMYSPFQIATIDPSLPTLKSFSIGQYNGPDQLLPHEAIVSESQKSLYLLDTDKVLTKVDLEKTANQVTIPEKLSFIGQYAFLNDDTAILADDKGAVHWCSTKTGLPFRHATIHTGPISSIALDSAGSLAATTGGREIALWDSTTGSVLWRTSFGNDNNAQIRVLKASNTVVGLSVFCEVTQRDLGDGRILKDFQVPGYSESAGDHCRLSPDGSVVVKANYKNGVIEFWDVGSEVLKKTMDLGEVFYYLEILDNNKRIAIGLYGKPVVHVFDIDTGSRLLEINNPSCTAGSNFSISGNEKRLIMSSVLSQDAYQVGIFDLSSAQLIDKYSRELHGSDSNTMNFSGNSAIFFGLDGSATLWQQN